MKKTVVELREYDVITSNLAASKESGAVYLEKKSFSELENLILTFNEGEQSDAIDFLTISSKKNVGKIIRAKNYVGVLELNNSVQVQILPKIHGGTKEDSKKTFLKMLKTLKDFPSKTFNVATLNTAKLPIFEIFIRLYIQEVQHLVKRGLKSSYYEVEDNLKVFKGRMNFSQQIKHNVVHKERFYVHYNEFGLNRPENRLIKSTLLKLIKESENLENIKELRRLLMSFEFVEPSQYIEKDFSQVNIDRNSKDYEIVINWSKVFLHNQSYTTFAGALVSKALLFPMDRVFESYVGRNLKRLIDPTEWTVSLQDRSYHLFKNQFALRPDMVLRNQVDNKTIIIDTKWKLLKNRPNSNYGISQADMYQMYAYAKKYGTTEIWLMYPMNDEFEGNEKICFESDDGVKVRVFFVDCHHIQDSLNKFFIIEARFSKKN
ncbi:MAG: McrC family protein [Carnobacterium alterfunditum]